MQVATGALWRIDYRLDASRADSGIVPIGYMLEADWDRRARWLGLLFRQRLTRVELDLVDLRTWPELENLDEFMNGMFDRAWNFDDGLGSPKLAAAYPVFSALQFSAQPLVCELGEFHRVESFSKLYGSLLQFEDQLVPYKMAEVLPFEKKIALPDTDSLDSESLEALAKAA